MLKADLVMQMCLLAPNQEDRTDCLHGKGKIAGQSPEHMAIVSAYHCYMRR